jgi:hypothetical protein
VGGLGDCDHLRGEQSRGTLTLADNRDVEFVYYFFCMYACMFVKTVHEFNIWLILEMLNSCTILTYMLNIYYISIICIYIYT